MTDNKQPQKKMVSFKLDVDSLEAIDTLARADHRTRSQYLQVLIFEKLQSKQAEGCKL